MFYYARNELHEFAFKSIIYMMEADTFIFNKQRVKRGEK